jgi:hypothetical protein
MNSIQVYVAIKEPAGERLRVYPDADLVSAFKVARSCIVHEFEVTRSLITRGL